MVINGRNMVDTSGWIGLSGAALSVVDGKLKIEADGISNNPYGRQTITTQPGVEYIFELSAEYIDNNYKIIITDADGTVLSSSDEFSTTKGRLEYSFTAKSTSSWCSPSRCRALPSVR